MSTNPLLAVDRKIIGDIYTTTEPMDNLTVLCDDFGSRFGGTQGEKEAVAFLTEKMAEYGLANIHTEPVAYTVWTRGAATLEILEPVQRTLPCISLPHCPAAQVEALLVDLDEGLPDHFDQRADEIQGNIVMASSEVAPYGTARRIHRSEKYGLSMVNGADAFIFMNHYPGFGPATGSIGYKGGPGGIPGISVCYEDGTYLQRLLARHGQVKLRITTTDVNTPGTSWNIVGELPGTAQTDEFVMVGCHYDGHDITQGAGDPASGAVALLEAARVMAAHAADLPLTVRFVLWGIEEIGLLGSKAYAVDHADELDHVRFYLNMDAAGMRPNYQDIVLNEWPALAERFATWRTEMADSFRIGQSLSAHSDHFPFFMAGVPTGGIQSADKRPQGRGYGHTYYDTLDKIDADVVRLAAVRAARWLVRMASADDWPVHRRSPEAVQALLDTPDYRAENGFRRRLAAYYEQG